ncbi:ankyrin repeat-containing protein 34 [Elsinoe australis]|uniref:Ankyrin repeat-containing protein 34 n=1 Tax=Elsinoe australis TaxID=40998 RepID=A0A4U7APF8_9PEZI|nr:ankyrin repeat-containing protein 34 [Elsinoe australis]
MIARDDSGLRLEEDDIDDILYSVRTDDKEELDSFLKSLADKYSIAEKDVLQSSVAEHSGNTAVHFAAANGLSALLTHILQILNLHTDSDYINQRNKAGNTALHWSSLNGHLETTKTLVEAGADLWARNFAGNLAVFEAERAGKDDVVAYLLKVGGTEKETEGQSNGAEASEEVAGEDVQMDDPVEAASEDMAATNLNG